MLFNVWPFYLLWVEIFSFADVVWQTKIRGEIENLRGCFDLLLILVEIYLDVPRWFGWNHRLVPIFLIRWCNSLICALSRLTWEITALLFHRASLLEVYFLKVSDGHDLIRCLLPYRVLLAVIGKDRVAQLERWHGLILPNLCCLLSFHYTNFFYLLN